MRRSLALCLVLFVLCGLAACAHMPRFLGGNANENLVLDGEQKHETDIKAGHTLTLDLRDPGSSGYAFAGANFNPDLLRLEAIEPHEGGQRVRYVFTAIAPGQTDILIKIRKNQAGYIPDVYKLVVVTVTN